MKKLIFVASVSLLLASCGNEKGDVTINLPEGFSEPNLVVSHVTIENAFNAKSQDDLKVVYDTIKVENGVARMNLDAAGAARYNVESPTVTMMQPEFFASPGESIVVNISSFEPLSYTVSGTPLMEDITKLYLTIMPIREEYMELLNKSDNVTEEQAQTYMNRYDEALRKFIEDHPDSHAVPYAILDLSGDDFKVYYDRLSSEAKKSILMPYAELYNKEVEKMLLEREKEADRKKEVASGTITAPGFTLPDLSGKKVSLSDFRGKWVVLDFWGSWCGWCIKGFPALREAYEKYGDKIVVIGIDCNESEAEWRAGVEKYKIPWLNLYNGSDRQLYADYQIEGFPTKAIINPEGKLVDLTTGEDPSFYDRLAAFVK